MSDDLVVKAWRDEGYWLSLTDSQRAQVPANPAGSTELLDAELDRVTGGNHASSHGIRCAPTIYTCDHCNFTAYSGGDTCCD